MADRARALLAVLVMCHAAEAWYIPGVSPRAYELGEDVDIFANSMTSTTGLFPYGAYSIKQCSPPADLLAQRRRSANMGELLWGDQIEPSLLHAQMRVPIACQPLCATMEAGTDFTEGDRKTIKERIEQAYRGNLVLDNLPVTTENPPTSAVPLTIGYPLGIPAAFADGQTLVNNHLALTIKYHKPELVMESEAWRIVGFSVEAKSVDHNDPSGCRPDAPWTASVHSPLVIDTASKITWSYSVKWVEDVETPWATRWDAILKSSAREDKAHWLSIMNSTLVVIALSGVIAGILLRAVKRDFIRYGQEMDEEADAIREESGWKLCHGDVFRPPQRAQLLSIAVGTGAHLLSAAFVILLFACLGVLSPANRGALAGTMLMLFYFCAGIGGYVTAKMLKQLKCQSWTAVFGTVLLFPGYCFGVYFCMNLLQWQKDATSAIPYTTLLMLLGLWGGLVVLGVLGAVVGFKRDADAMPCLVTTVPRNIPPQEWYLGTRVAAFAAGLLPFGAAYLELVLILNSLWKGHVYYVFGFLGLAFIILILICAEVSIVYTYVQLTCEDYHWWWRAFIAPATSAVYIALYCVYYYHKALTLSTVAATALYTGYMSIVIVFFAVTTGSVGFFAAFVFVRVIYANVKID